jgi:hypothetical protein
MYSIDFQCSDLYLHPQTLAINDSNDPFRVKITNIASETAYLRRSLSVNNIAGLAKRINMYRAGPTKFALAAIVPANALAITKMDSALHSLKTVLKVFEVLLVVWLLAFTGVALLASVLKRKPDLRAPRVTLPPKPGSQ